MLNMIPYSNSRIGMPGLLGLNPFRLFDDISRWSPFVGDTAWSAMPVEVKSDDDHVYLTVDLPGVNAEDVDLTFDHGSLTIEGRRGDRSYRYTVELGSEIDPSSIEAQLDKGVLVVKASKRPEAKPRKIALNGTTAKRLEAGESK
jgi:HSP20 family protein